MIFRTFELCACSLTPCKGFLAPCVCFLTPYISVCFLIDMSDNILKTNNT